VEGKSILLVDDICTSGATAQEASKTLLKAGAGKVFVYTLARSVLR
jgi:predicted amidophosphoribosyltransferase